MLIKECMKILIIFILEEDLVPQRYLKHEIKYTKMGLDEIDFNRFNRTSFCGLEANLPNAYCNNMIQVSNFYLLCFFIF